nr:tRNA (adenosine(37)-N6)-threonylcarbamoyltransferase complex dimerization subunit type 1 TsaB [Microbulbifer zhoushanensis]
MDTTSGSCSVALSDGDLVREQFVAAERDHTRRLLPMVDQVLAEAGLKLSDLDALAVSRGPGSFTGLRIAISTTQGLAYAADLPVIPVSSLAALAAGARRQHRDWSTGSIIAALDARMQQVYWGVYSAASPAQSLLPEAVQDPEAVAAVIAGAELDSPLYGAGPGWHYEGLATAPVTATDQNCPIHARDIAELARAAGTAAAVTAEQLEPLYLRNEVTWKKRQKIRSE